MKKTLKFLLLFFVGACSAYGETTINKTYNIDDFFVADKYISQAVSEIYKKLSDEEKAGIVLMPAWEKGVSLRDVELWKTDYYIGGIMVLRNDFTKKDIAALKKSKNIDLLTSIDAEPSLLWKNFPDIYEEVGATNKLKTTKSTKIAAQKIGKEMQNSLIDINFAPIYDSGENEEIIGNRAFGTENKNIQKLATKFSESLKNQGIFSTAKHFPGHGKVIGDSHKILPQISGKLLELDNFIYAIDHKIPIMMMGHLEIVDNEQWQTDSMPASVSHKIITELLRKKLGFRGLVITDAMNMGGVADIEDADILALEAGVDMLLMPENLEETYNKILEKYQLDKNFRKSMDEKIKRILTMKVLRDALMYQRI